MKNTLISSTPSQKWVLYGIQKSHFVSWAFSYQLSLLSLSRHHWYSWLCFWSNGALGSYFISRVKFTLPTRNFIRRQQTKDRIRPRTRLFISFYIWGLTLSPEYWIFLPTYRSCLTNSLGTWVNDIWFSKSKLPKILSLFGIVTLKWWNDLWLNEGFASYCEYKAVNHVHPDWEIEAQFVSQDLTPVLVLDGKHSSHPIVQPVSHPDQITEIFDSISYNKVIYSWGTSYPVHKNLAKNNPVDKSS